MRLRAAIGSVTVLATLGASTGGTQTTPAYQSAIDAYRSSLAQLETHAKGRRDLEAAYQAALKIREALLTESPDGKGRVLDSLPSDEYKRLQDELPGININREEILYSEPDPDFFVQLAVGHGEEADRLFFAALKATYPESVWPVYVEQQTDYSGCTRFGSGTLVATYRLWSEFRQRFPGRYPATVQKETTRVTEALTRGTCTCGDSTSVERELRQFARSFPTSPFRQAVDARLRLLHAGQLNIRPRCSSG